MTRLKLNLTLMLFRRSWTICLMNKMPLKNRLLQFKVFRIYQLNQKKKPFELEEILVSRSSHDVVEQKLSEKASEPKDLSERSKVHVEWDDHDLNAYLYDAEPEKDNNFFDVGRDNFFSTLAYAMEGGGDFFEQDVHVIVENDPYAFYEAMFES